MPRLPLGLGLVEQAVSGGVRGVSAKGAPHLDGRRAGLGTLGALELAVPLLSADVAVVFLPVIDVVVVVVPGRVMSSVRKRRLGVAT